MHTLFTAEHLAAPSYTAGGMLRRMRNMALLLHEPVNLNLLHATLSDIIAYATSNGCTWPQTDVNHTLNLNSSVSTSIVSCLACVHRPPVPMRPPQLSNMLI
jgi:hypothetical protein